MALREAIGSRDAAPGKCEILSGNRRQGPAGELAWDPERCWDCRKGKPESLPISKGMLCKVTLSLVHFGVLCNTALV